MEWLFGCAEAACFLAWSDEDEAVGYIEGIYLDAAHRGRGLGREMVDFAAAWFEARGCVNMAADAEIGNEAAQAVMRSTGFTETWRVVGYTRPVRG